MRGLAVLSAGLVAITLVGGCRQINMASSADSTEMSGLRTDVASMGGTQSAQDTALAEQAAQLTRLSGFVSYLATSVPRITSTVGPPTITPFTVFDGSVLLEDGRCCAGGPAGVPLILHAQIRAHSINGPVTHMRLWIGPSQASQRDLTSADWVPFSSQAEFEVVPTVNWTGFFVSVQFRDSSGAVSQVFSDDISIEGMPPGATLTP
jgi:hypothetical protein